MFVLCLFILAALHVAHGQGDCIPDPVRNVQLDLDDRLHWQPSTNCENTMYIIFMGPVGGEVTNRFETLQTRIYVSLLPMCEMFVFRVVAVSNNVASRESVLQAPLPTRPGADVTVTHIQATHRTEDSIILEWELNELYAHCVQYFRVVRWDFENTPVSTYATYGYVHLDGFVPCSRYELTVTPIYNYQEEGGAALLLYDTPAYTLDVPTILAVRPGTTFIDLTLGLPPYIVNRCIISSIIVDGAPFVNLTIPIVDSGARPNVPIHVDSLQPDRMYLFRISVVNSAGASQPIPIGIQTLPATKDSK